MIIPFSENNHLHIQPIYLGNISRFPSVTDIKFLNKNLIVVAHRFACKLYLMEINYEKNTYTIIDTFITKDVNGYHCCESFEIKNNKLYLIFFSNVLWIFDIFHNKFILHKKLFLKNNNTYHGIKIYNDFLYLTPSNMLINNSFQDNILKINIHSHSIEMLPLGNIENNYRIKDIAFINDNYIILIILYKTNIALKIKNQFIHGMIALFSYPTLQLLDKIDYKQIHFDRIIYRNNYFYITGQNETSGIIYKGCVDINNQKILNIKEINVFDFPHGLDIYDGLFAYTSYGNESLIIDNLENF